MKEQSDPKQGSVLRSWLSGRVLPAFEGRVLAVDATVARCAAAMHVPNRRPERDCLSVCSKLVGQALRDGRIRSLDETLAQLLPEAIGEVPDSPARSVILRQILSGRSGLAFDPMRFAELAGAKPLVQFALSRSAVAVDPPGWSYNDAMVALIAPMLLRGQGADLATLAARDLFDALGIQRFTWRRDLDGNALAPAGLDLRPRDLLKLPVLMIDAGRWQGRQVLPRAVVLHP